VIALTEESFHQGDWATVLQKDITFEITAPNIPSAQSIDYVDIGDLTAKSII